MTDAAGERPYLERVPLERTETLIEWASYLGRTFGTAGALAALRHYERLAWLSPAARRDVERHLRGLSLDDLHAEGDERSHDLPGPLADLSETPFAPHAWSLAYVAALAGDDLEDDVLRASVAKRRAGVVDADESRQSRPD
jgi:archaellum component FlaD/FlaE